MNKLPCGYALKSTANYFWVDGCCGYCVANGNTAANAVENALIAINNETNRIKNGGIGKAVWMV